jgi:hypothetical protein
VEDPAELAAQDNRPMRQFTSEDPNALPWEVTDNLLNFSVTERQVTRRVRDRRQIKRRRGIAPDALTANMLEGRARGVHDLVIVEQVMAAAIGAHATHGAKWKQL